MVAWRAWAKAALGATLWPVLGPAALARIGGDQGLILMLHHVGPPVLPGAEDYLFLTPSALGRILDFVASSLRPLPPLEFLDRLARGDLPPRATLLTFDDGTADQVTVAAPEFTRRGLAACFFVCPGLIERRETVPTLELATLCQHGVPGEYEVDIPPELASVGPGKLRVTLGGPAARVRVFRVLLPVLLDLPSRRRFDFLAGLRTQWGVAPAVQCPYPLATWEQLDELARAGMVIANHTLYHSTPAADGPAQFVADVADAFAVLDRRFPLPRRLFCYPYGRPTDALPAAEDALRRLGVDYAFVVQGGLAQPRRTGLLRLHRQAIDYGADSARLAVLRAALRRR